MKITGIEGMTREQINRELEKGGKFVIFQYCISIVILTFRRSSNIYFIQADQNALIKSIPYSLISLFLGWWGFPWGPIYTVGSIITNFKGGKNITPEVISSLNQK
ncbi:MAG: hypothetical protein AAGF26_14920 [Cyanobacteria bacterium P01_G01_bin.49]